MGLIPTIPAILTDANWQKEKGIVAKIFKTETGIGDLMKKLDAVYKQVDWTLYDPKTKLLPAQRTHENIDNVLAQAKAQAGKLEAVRAAAFALRDKARVVAGEFAKVKLIPSSSRKHVEEIAKACELFALQCKSMDTKDFEQLHKEADENVAKAKQMLKMWVDAIKSGAAAVKSKPTPEEYTAKLYQKVRGLGTSIGVLQELRGKYSPIWGNSGMSSQSWINDATTPDKMKAKVDHILSELSKFESEAKSMGLL